MVHLKARVTDESAREQRKSISWPSVLLLLLLLIQISVTSRLDCIYVAVLPMTEKTGLFLLW